MKDYKERHPLLSWQSCKIQEMKIFHYLGRNILGQNKDIEYNSLKKCEFLMDFSFCKQDIFCHKNRTFQKGKFTNTI